MSTLFAASGELGTWTPYSNAGWTGGGISVGTGSKHQTLAGVGGSYSFVMNDYFGAWFAVASLPAAYRYLHHWTYSTGAYLIVRFYQGGSVQDSWRHRDDTGKIELYRGNIVTLLATSTNTYRLDFAHWYVAELLAQDANGIFTVWCDGVQVATYNGDTQTTASAGWDQIHFEKPNWNQPIVYVDDVIMTDAAGGRLPETICQPMVPDANTATINLTPVPAGAGTNWDRVNEIPASQADYCEATAVGQEDIYDLTSPATLFTSVTCVSAWAWCTRDGVITTAKTGVTTASGGGASTTTYRADYVLPAVGTWGAFWQVVDLDPDTGAAFLPADMPGVQANIMFN